MNKGDRRFDPQDYIPRRFGLKYSPIPQIILEYLVPSIGKLYHHKIKLPSLTADSNSTVVINEIYELHHVYLNHKRVSQNQIAKLVDKLKAYLKQHQKKVNDDRKNDCQEYTDTGMELNSGNVDEDLNKLTTEELRKKKEEMDKLYQKNFISPDDNNFIFDVRVKYLS